MTRHHHIFIAAPASGGIGAQMARSLSGAQKALAQAGYGPAVLGAHREGQIHLDTTLIGDAAAGLFHFFARAGERAECFAEALGGPVGRLVLHLPCYDAYYPMLWRHLAERRALKPFEGAVEQLAGRGRGWLEVVAELKTALDPREIVLLPAPALAEEALAALVPGARVIARSIRQERQSDTAIAMMQRLHRSKIRIRPKQMERLARFHEGLPQGAPIAEFDPLTASRLRRRFQQDLRRLVAMDRVRIGADPALAVAAQ
ncbi:hypothetical protein [Thioclava atlantica]|uniref:Uncharacterized protein n=1 Tax=Thioclava atlantica TaxID=1317124 RepID=A0A085TV08_9RHOB|nr:hypothetical protein [Thioclava atlantica]KFE34555.1 hypothetical protein DW2_11910 [Thioclava atlantica]